LIQCFNALREQVQAHRVAVQDFVVEGFGVELPGETAAKARE
jgi:hypothetical protein